jgi:hypothetical protein
MIKPDIEALGVQERILLFCLASRTDWKQAGVPPKTVAGMVMKFPCLPHLGQRGATTPRLDRCRPRHPTGAVAGPMTAVRKLN